MIEQLDPHITSQLDHSALLVIDTQVDFVDVGSFPVPGWAVSARRWESRSGRCRMGVVSAPSSDVTDYLAARCRAL